MPRTQRSAISAFSRVFDALWLLRSGALQSRGRNERRCLVRSRFCEAALRKSYALHRARDKVYRALVSASQMPPPIMKPPEMRDNSRVRSPEKNTRARPASTA